MKIGHWQKLFQDGLIGGTEMYWYIDALRMQIVRKSKNSNNYEMFYVNAAGRRNVLCQRRGTTEYFMPTPRDACMGSNMVRADFGSGLIRPGLKHAAR